MQQVCESFLPPDYYAGEQQPSVAWVASVMLCSPALGKPTVALIILYASLIGCSLNTPVNYTQSTNVTLCVQTFCNEYRHLYW